MEEDPQITCKCCDLRFVVIWSRDAWTDWQVCHCPRCGSGALILPEIPPDPER